MKRPFDFMPDGVTKIDANNPAHQEIVIQRNVKLAKAITQGIEAYYVINDLLMGVHYCLKCGTNVYKKEHGKELDKGHWDVPTIIKNIKCPCCNTVLKYDDENDVFKVKIPKPSFKAKKVRA